MNSLEKYCVFSTKWGYFGISARNGLLTRTCLPDGDPRLVELEMLRHGPCEYDSDLLPLVQEQIQYYFEEKPCSLDQIDLDLTKMSAFAQHVYTALRQICPGHTTSYSQLARQSGYPNAARAVGRVMAGNPMPLIIPCHRVLTANGKLGGFSGIGGAFMKQSLLEHESLVRTIIPSA